MIQILFAIYIAFLLTNLFPFPNPVSPVALFVILFIIVFLFLSQAKIFKKAKRFSSRELVLSILMIGLLLTIILSFSKIALFNKLPFQLQQVFISKYSLFVWFAMPLVALVLIKKKGKDKE